MIMLSGVRVLVFNAPFNNISVISWWSVLLMDRSGGNQEYLKKTTDLPQVPDKLYRIMLY